ncbi:glycoside hydrolase family 3 protein [Botryobasidium botryosum FD-172 SS1]|uniref:Glycoside hydrolase family 3 protein n=1 Tax=Botryobasidium botryosum (strain FD-172 SS1) TaxID=930990 RepID=A0A067MY30_BOTB1|nr:glycoside hydrolase family 3 protein [Botryobasidium botryosum FD-172 SS1]
MSSENAVELTDALKREIGQHFIFGFHGTQVSDDIVTLIRDYHVGNVIIFKRNVQDLPRLRALTDALQKIAKDAGHARPLMIGIDQENGLVSAMTRPNLELAGTQFPGAMAMAATQSTELVKEVAQATGREMRAAGLNWVFSPVADINSDPRNPVIGVRSFGDDPTSVASYVSALSQGFLASNVAPTPKHFPGHGDTHVDSHVGLPIIRKSLAQLHETELVPFERLIKEGVPTIMSGHMALPLLEPNSEPAPVPESKSDKNSDSDNNNLTPASLSREITTELLRKKMGYTGVVVTDCLEMDAVASAPGGAERGAVRALHAGADVVMICHRMDRQVGAVRAVWDALRSGELGKRGFEELEESGKRVRRLKDVFAGTWDDYDFGGDFGRGRLEEREREVWAMKKVHKELSERAYAASTALVRDPLGVLPLSHVASGTGTAARVLLLTPRPESLNAAVDDPEHTPAPTSAEEGTLRTADGKLRNTAGPSYNALAAAVERRLARANGERGLVHYVYSRDTRAKDVLDSFGASRDGPGAVGVIIFATQNAHPSKEWQLALLRDLLTSPGITAASVPAVLLATCGPYECGAISGTDAAGKELEGVACVATFEFTPEALEAGVKVLFGEVKPAGMVPVRLSESAGV